MDGFGINPNHKNNAVYSAKTPNLDKFVEMYPHTQIGASGMDVGLPDGQMGNSEVGHTNIGAGRVVYQELTRITKSITDGDFFENPVLLAAMDNCLEKEPPFILRDFFPTAAFTATTPTFGDFSSLPKRRA